MYVWCVHGFLSSKVNQQTPDKRPCPLYFFNLSLIKPFNDEMGWDDPMVCSRDVNEARTSFHGDAAGSVRISNASIEDRLEC